MTRWVNSLNRECYPCGLATLAVVLVVVAVVACSVTGGDEVVEIPPVVSYLGLPTAATMLQFVF